MPSDPIADFLKSISGVTLPTDLEDTTEEEKLYVETTEKSESVIKPIVRELQEKAREKTKTLKIENQNLKNLAEHRIKYSWFIFVFVVTFVAFTMAVVYLVGFEFMKISDNVLNVLIGAAMIKVIGVLYIVAKWLYPQHGKNKN